jgi:GT2 family glycosyltransferase
MKDLITVSIVLYKTPLEHLRRCFESLKKVRVDLHLYLIDNSPSNALEAHCPPDISHEYFHRPDNPGFGRAHNVAIIKSRTLESKYHLILNADVSFETDVLSPMLEYMAKNPRAGQMMPKVCNPDGTTQHLCKLVPTPADLLVRRFLSGEFIEQRNSRFELRHSGYDQVMFVPYLSGCFMLLRQSALLEVGLFDERFFMYPEDIDLTRRMAERYDTVYFPKVSVVHEHGAASYKSAKMLVIHALNICRYFNKWGWLYDPARNRLNRKTLEQIQRLMKP